MARAKDSSDGDFYSWRGQGLRETGKPGVPQHRSEIALGTHQGSLDNGDFYWCGGSSTIWPRVFVARATALRQQDLRLVDHVADTERRAEKPCSLYPRCMGTIRSGPQHAAFALALWAGACGGRHASQPPSDAGGDAITEAGPVEPDVGPCTQAPQEAGEQAEPPPEVDLDGGVPLTQAALATAIVQCEYWSRCSSLAAYELHQCIDSLTQTGGWTYGECTPEALDNATGAQCLVVTFSASLEGIAFPGPRLIAAVEAGIVAYDPTQEAACLRAQQGQPCNGSSPTSIISACAAALSCASAAGSGDAGAPGTDAAPSCADFAFVQTTLTPCLTASDCVGVADAGGLSGPYCMSGYCRSAPCDQALLAPDGSCLALVDVGQPCDSDAPRIGGTTLTSPLGHAATRTCGSGLTCRGLQSDGGLGICSAPQEVGGSCVSPTVVSGCALGLVCRCGACQVPPAQGSCVNDSCRFGVAYCDTTGVCQPARGIGQDCSEGAQMCRTGLACDSGSKTCQPQATP